MRKTRSTTDVIHSVNEQRSGVTSGTYVVVTTCGRTLKRPRMVEDYKRVDCTKCRRTDPNLDVPTERGLPISVVLSPPPNL